MMEGLGIFAFGADGWGDELLAGGLLTLALAAATLPCGIVLGLLGAGAKLSRNPVLKALGGLYTTLIRGVPELLIILSVYYGAGFLLRSVLTLFGSTQYVEINAFAAGVFSLAIVFGGFATEVFRGAFLSVPKGQVEAAQAFGMTPFQCFWRIQLPQVWRIALPGLGNLWLTLLKDTTLVTVIALDELVRNAQVAIRATKQPFDIFLVVALAFLLITIVSMIIQGRLEARAARGVRRA